MKTVDYLDAVKARHRLTSDYQLTKLTGWNKQRVSNYRNGVSYFDESACIRVAELLDLNPAEVLADVAAERSNSTEAAEIWRGVADTFRRAALSIGAAFVAFSVAAPDVYAAGLCILCKKARAAVEQWLIWVFPPFDPHDLETGADTQFTPLGFSLGFDSLPVSEAACS